MIAFKPYCRMISNDFALMQPSLETPFLGGLQAIFNCLKVWSRLYPVLSWCLLVRRLLFHILQDCLICSFFHSFSLSFCIGLQLFEFNCSIILGLQLSFCKVIYALDCTSYEHLDEFGSWCQHMDIERICVLMLTYDFSTWIYALMSTCVICVPTSTYESTGMYDVNLNM